MGRGPRSGRDPVSGSRRRRPLRRARSGALDLPRSRAGHDRSAGAQRRLRPIAQDATHGKVAGVGFAWHLDDDHTQLGAGASRVQFSEPRTLIAHLDTGWSTHETRPPELDLAASTQLRARRRAARRRTRPRQRRVPGRQLRPRHRHAEHPRGRAVRPPTSCWAGPRAPGGADPCRRSRSPAPHELARHGRSCTRATSGARSPA